MVKSRTHQDAETLVWKSEPETQAISEPNKEKNEPPRLGRNIAEIPRSG